MNTNEACNILGIKPGSSKEDVSKAFKALALKYHPDINKANNAESKFKQINAAYQFLQENGTVETSSSVDDIFSDFYNTAYSNNINNFRINFNSIFFDKFQNDLNKNPEICTYVNLNFAESVLGVSRNVSFDRVKICHKCKGACSTFDGKTRTVCKSCRGIGTIDAVEKLKINIPPGVKDGSTVKLKGKGNHNSDAHVGIKVIPDPDMSLNDKDVYSAIQLTMLECLEGTTKEVKTVKGVINLKIPSKVRHKDNSRAKGYGVPPDGSHIFVVEMEYPEDIEPVIDALKNDGYR